LVQLQSSLEEAEADHYQSDDYDPFITLKSSDGLFDKCYSFARRLMLAWKSNLVRSALRSNSDDRQKRRVLDVGCSTGEFLTSISSHCEVEGIEPESRAAQWAERLGLNVHNGTLQSFVSERESAGQDVGEYDLITMWHVLEHVPDPVVELKQLHNLLSPTGILLIALPNIESFDSRLYRSCWVALDAPRHLWHFSPKPLKQLAEKCGFCLTRSGMLPLDTFYNSMLSEQICLKTNGLTQLFIVPFRIFISIIGSLVYGALNSSHSSMYYIFEKVE